MKLKEYLVNSLYGKAALSTLVNNYGALGFDEFKNVELIDFLDRPINEDFTCIKVFDSPDLEFNKNIKLYGVEINDRGKLLYWCSPDSIKEKLSKVEVIMYDQLGEPVVKSISDFSELNSESKYNLDMLKLIYDNMFQEYLEQLKKVDLDYYDEETFKKTTFKFNKDYFNLAVGIKSSIETYLNTEFSFTGISPNKDGNKLVIGAYTKKRDINNVSERYKITIEKVKL